MGPGGWVAFKQGCRFGMSADKIEKTGESTAETGETSIIDLETAKEKRKRAIHDPETAVDLVITQLKSAHTGLLSCASETVEILVWVNMVLQTG